ncbi:MAG: hypothetical protein HY962_04485 [Ignavibacteriae bacterium]|nr:hypothetical protein [Ignavibacteriota bacterium]
MRTVSVLVIAVIFYGFLLTSGYSQNIVEKRTTPFEGLPFAGEYYGLRIGTVRFVGDVKNVTEFQGSSTPFHGAFDAWYRKALIAFGVESQYLVSDLELSAGYRFLHGEHSLYEFRTFAFPLSASVTGELLLHRSIRPFISLGAGLVPYDLKIVDIDPSILASRMVSGSEMGVGIWFPIRCGIHIAVSDAADLSVSLERSITLTDRMDGIISNGLDWMNDNFQTISVGIAVHLSPAPNSIVLDMSDPPSEIDGNSTVADGEGGKEDADPESDEDGRDSGK